ncbi:MAG: 2TM domain-containing protein [Promethearchaeota archaeon]
MNKPEVITQISTPEKPKNMKKSTAHKILLKLHLFLYSAVMALLILIWALVGDISFFLPAFPILGWGIGIGLHLIGYLIYFDKVSYLTKIKEQSTLGLLFIFHIFIYVMVNLIVLCGDLLIPGVVFFYWPLSMWGVGILFHALAFFTWDMLMVNERAKIMRKYPNYEAQKINKIATRKISNLWILVVHITYFAIINILIYTVIPNLANVNLGDINMIDRTIYWSVVLVIHIFSFFLRFYNESIKPNLKGLIIHISLYVASNILLIYEWNKSDIAYFWPIYSLILWGIIIRVHVSASLKYDNRIKKALIKVEKHITDVDEYELHSKARRLVLWQYSFFSHLIIYAIGILLMAITMIIIAVDLSNIVHPIMGWGIGISVHGAIYLIVRLRIKGFWKGTFTLHLAVYISTNIYLIILNIMMGGFPWSAIAMVGWGIGLGVHTILAYVC